MAGDAGNVSITTQHPAQLIAVSAAAIDEPQFSHGRIAFVMAKQDKIDHAIARHAAGAMGQMEARAD